MMLYLWMVPFLKSSPGGSQESIMDLELVALKVMFSGIAVCMHVCGTTNISHIATAFMLQDLGIYSQVGHSNR